jgi:hypothetical protein
MQISNAGKIQATNTLAKAQIAGTDLQAQPNAIGCLCVASRCVTGKQGVWHGRAAGWGRRVKGQAAIWGGKGAKGQDRASTKAVGQNSAARQ